MPPSSEIDLDTFDPKLELPRNTRGELWARAGNIMKGYWKNPAATASTLTRDGWLKTGDICYVDDQNHVFVVDRLKELIKVKGNQVAPAELEALFLEHPAVGDAAIIGVPDGAGDERVRAYIVRRSDEAGQKVTANELVEWMKERTARHKWITAGVRFVEEIPKNPSGKILRRQLRGIGKDERTKERSEQGARL